MSIPGLDLSAGMVSGQQPPPQASPSSPQSAGLDLSAGMVGQPAQQNSPDFTLGGVAKGASDEALGAIKGMATTLFPGQNEGIETLQQIPAVYRAYETARQQGKGIMDAVSAANDEANRQETARNVIKQRIQEFSTNPDQATGKTLVDAIGVLMGAKGLAGEVAEAGALEGASGAAEGATEAPKPGIVKQVLKGKDVTQPEIQESLKSVGNADEPSIRESLTKPIAEARTSKEALYKAYDDAAGVDRKALQERLDNTQDQMSKLTGTAVDMRRLSRLQEAETALKTEIAGADSKAEASGVKISDADAANVKLRALEDVEKNVFKNQDVVKGNTAQGEPEHVDVDNAIKAIQKMKDNEKFGGPRWDQAFETGSGDRVLRQLREYRATGQTALTKQTFAKWLGRTAATAGGLGLLYEGGKALVE